MWRAIFSLARFTASPHTAIMATAPRKVEFVPTEMKVGRGWYVKAVLPNAPPLHLGGFKTESEAMEWVARKSKKWLNEYLDGKYA
jgi:hypothetical protein